MPNLGVYIPDQLNTRLQRLREKGIDLNVSNVASRALEVAVESEEKAFSGDRVTRLVTRLRQAKTPTESAIAEGEAAGTLWAEDVAALSELHLVRDLLNRLNNEAIDIIDVRLGYGVMLELGQWDDVNDDMVPLGEVVQLPGSVPRDFFEHARQPRENKIIYSSSIVFGFLRAATNVLAIYERAMFQDEVQAVAKKLRTALSGKPKRANQQQPEEKAEGQPLAAPTPPED